MISSLALRKYLVPTSAQSRHTELLLVADTGTKHLNIYTLARYKTRHNGLPLYNKMFGLVSLAQKWFLYKLLPSPTLKRSLDVVINTHYFTINLTITMYS